MPRFPKWDWASSQGEAQGSRSGAEPSSVPARPCLPSVEPLDARRMFSASFGEIVIVKQVDKSSPMLAVAESQVLTPVPGANADPNAVGQFVQLANDFHKVNDLLLKYESDILSQKVAPNEGFDLKQALSDLFAKIEGTAIKLDGGTNTLLPAVQNVFDLAVGGPTAEGSNFGPSILDDLNALAGQLKAAPLPDAEADVLAKMAGDFWKLGETALDYKLQLLQGVPADVAQAQATFKEQVEYIKLKLEEVLISGYISQADQSDLGQTIDGAFNLVNGVINPSTTAAGPTVPGVPGDTIS